MTKLARRGLWTPSMAGGLLLGLGLLVAAILAPVLLAEPAEQLTDAAGQPPSAEHWLGTDNLGRDNLARALVATRLTLLMTAGATAIAVVGGIVVGVGVWLSGPRVRKVGLRLLETAVAYPSLIFALVIAAILRPGVVSSVVAIGVAGIPSFARLTANLAAKISTTDYVTTARLLGVSPRAVALRHVLPNMAEPLLILATTVFSLSLVELSALSFIGLGVQSPDYDFGLLLNESLTQIYTQPTSVLGPSVMIVLTGVAVMLLGDALAARANPRQGRRAVRNPAGPPVVEIPDGDTALVRVEDLRVRVPGGAELVKGVSLTIEPGEVVGLVGESGSGKSLTAMSVAGLPPAELEVRADVLRVDDLNMLGHPDRGRLGREISIIYQDPGTTFNPSLRMGVQLTEVLRTHLGVGRGRANKLIADALAQVNISEPERRLRQHPHKLSGGMRQRGMIATTLVTTPKLIVADEPTTALDVTVQHEVLRQFRRIHREQGAAMLFISHDLGVVQELCDRILVMRHGEIVEQLTPGQLREGDVHHPYTQALMDAVLVVDTSPVRQEFS
ncbi:dipeptide/oligopeptide/nickel ABC transporter permease/ATP-binding protein [Prauserella cavernicola]|uniref:Dipeptide/oligopeptide/nickel ABC transporter permease/ATP-binding protein n=1 Tax=Prauserella cavernicola TaxID=2800127 RepID=A0A934QVR6_9PSEU|nr:dipeptide/oligopeptide/nickel ABC transporter permease/ATP-binding protein [Prauserella cavernicola]MBK1789157.1 dipeptide/oligopeptide/nickel ABC transporter permease/ATP-binding protein [Prauserella cavernicola]